MIKTAIYPRLFEDICGRLQEEVPQLRLVDHDWGQDQTDVRPALAYPAALIDFPDTSFEEMGDGDQTAEATVTVRIFFDSFAQSSALAPKQSREIALRCYEVEHAVVSALHGWMPDDGYCQPLIRTSARSENRNDIGLRIRTVTFTTAFEELFDNDLYQ